MALCVMTGGTLWMPLLCVLSWVSQTVSIKLPLANEENVYLAMRFSILLVERNTVLAHGEVSTYNWL